MTGLQQLLTRIWAMRGLPNQHPWLHLTDGLLLAPIGRTCHRTLGCLPSATLARLLQEEQGPIHWIRPGGMGDWVILAPFLDGVRRWRNHPEDTLWVTPGAFSLAKTYHQGTGLRIRLATAGALIAASKPSLLLQLEPFHPAAWIWAGLLHADRVAGYPPSDPCSFSWPPVRPMIDDMAAFHPGIDPFYPEPVPKESRSRILVFASGAHPARQLPPAFAQRLADGPTREVSWFGPLPLKTLPKGWEWVQERMLAPDLLSRIRYAKGLVGPDSGPYHLGRLLGTPTVGYFTSGELGRWGWPTPHSRVVVTSFHCRGCTVGSYPAPCPHGFGCVEDKDVLYLIEALDSVMGIQL